MRIFVKESTFSWSCVIWRWNLSRSRQSARSYGLEGPNFSSWSSEFSWFSRLLPSVHSELLQNHQANDKIALERWEVCVDSEVWSCFSHFTDFVDFSSCFGTTWYRETFWYVLWCIRYRFGMCSDVGRSSHCLCLTSAEEAWSKLPNSWLGISRVIHALKIWRHYLLGNVCHIYTNHKSLKYIFTQPELNMR